MPFRPSVNLNKHSFDDPRVHVTNADAFVWLDGTQTEPFDIAIVDFPDPEQFCAGQALHDALLQPFEIKAQTGFVGRDPNHIAACRPAIVLVHRQNARVCRLYCQAIPNNRSEFWHLGICAGKTAAL